MGEVGTVFKPSSIFLTDRSKVVFLFVYLFVICVCLCHTVMSVSCSLLVTCWKRADLLALLYVIYLCFCHILFQCPGSGVVFDCIDS